MALTTVQQGVIASGVAGTGPAFSAYANTSTTMPTGTYTKIAFQIEDWDTASCFNNTASTVGGIPAYSFLPNVAGYYHVSGSLQINGTTAGLAAIYKNAGVWKNGNYNGVAGTSAIVAVSCDVYLNGTTDYIALYGYVDAGTGLVAQQSTCFFQASLVRAA